jgi:hypothetical protein
MDAAPQHAPKKQEDHAERRKCGRRRLDSGIGLAIARAPAEHGANVTINGFERRTRSRRSAPA